MIDVEGLVYDEDNAAELTARRISVAEVQQVFDGSPRYFSGRGGHLLMVGSTRAGRLIVVSLERWGADRWRPTQAFDAREVGLESIGARRDSE